MCIYENIEEYSMFDNVKVVIDINNNRVNVSTDVQKEGCLAPEELGEVKRIVVFGRSVDLSAIFTKLEESMLRGRAGTVYTNLFDYDEVGSITVTMRDESEDVVEGYEAESQTLYAHNLYNSSETLFGGQD